MYSERPVTVIAPPQAWPRIDFAEIWRYRDLLSVLVWRDVSARYRQSLIGIGWAVVRPILSMLVFTLVFGKMVQVSSDGAPYAIFNYCGLLPWMFFSTCLQSTGSSIVGSQALVTKVYFPRLILPLSKVAVGLVDFAIQFLMLLGLMVWFDVDFTWRLAVLPLLLLATILPVLAVGILVSTISVKYRDMHHIIPFVVQFWMWLTPIVYSSQVVPKEWRMVYGLNPLVGIVDGFRWAILGLMPPDPRMMAVSMLMALLLLIGSLMYFHRQESTFADII